MLRQRVREFVEDNLSKATPGKAFTAAIVAALPAGRAEAAVIAGGSAGQLLSAAQNGGLVPRQHCTLVSSSFLLTEQW